MGKICEETFHKKGIKMANQHMERYSISLAIKEIKIKTTMRYCYTYQNHEIKDSDKTKCCGGEEKLDVKWSRHFGKENGRKLKIRLLYDPAIALFRHLFQRNEKLHSHKNLYTNVHSSFICNSQNQETTQMSFNQ